MSKAENFIEYINGGLDCSTEGIVKLQDTIARLSYDELTEAYNLKPQEVLFALTKAWGPMDVIGFYNDHPDSPMSKYRSEICRLKQLYEDLQGYSEKLIKDKEFHKENFLNANQSIEKFKTQLFEQLKKNEILECTISEQKNEILTLKAKLYDLMVGGEENA